VYFEGRLENGEIVDSNLADAEPHRFELDCLQVFPGFEKAVRQLTVGEEREFAFNAEQAYGPYDKRAVQRSRKSLIKGGDSMVVGQRILMRSPNSIEPVPGVVTAVAGDFVEVDFNHPLAGKDLFYRIKLMSREESEAL
jgi:FKBP-type peptidyl-prolyl cis-trans isomerase 2